ncbi:MAG TPA: 16S rRNA (cytosine(967)-C(5))-methyltransferase RsmB [Desulfobacteraceae bacterium]|nr:16S rRNA (cytosine(967)-C(5))-methyltransferase RsmB [Desulfobacteraceae bacterium]
MAGDSRAIAFRILTAGQHPKTTLDRAVDQAEAELAELSRQDRNLTHAIIFGVLRHRGHLDHLIRVFSRIPMDRLDAKVLTILRMGIFQIVFLDRVPDFAAIHTTIELAKTQVNKKSRGFINAVLRQAAKGHDTVASPDRKQFGAWLQVRYSIPSWLGKRWAAAYGKADAEAIAAAALDIPPVTLRVNSMKTCRKNVADALAAEGLEPQLTDISPLGIHLSGTGRSPADLPGFTEGHFQVQDEAAQLVVQALAPEPGERVLDACAGLGGKTCHIGQLMGNSGTVTAVDVDARKLGRLEAEAGRLGLSNINTCAVDMIKADVNTFDGYFDRVLVDAPCTGLGVLRRNPDTRWKRTAKDIQRMAAQQKKILNAAANLVAPGGTLVFAVCSCEPEENEAVVLNFLEKRKDYEGDAAGFRAALPEFVAQLGPDAEKDIFQAKTYPCHTGMDGFFLARLKRKMRKTARAQK